MTEKYLEDNPAGRLYAILTQLKEIAAESQRMQKQREKPITARTALARIFDVSPSDHSVILTHWAAVLDLPGKIYAEVAQLRHSARYTATLPKLEEALTMLILDHPIDNWVSRHWVEEKGVPDAYTRLDVCAGQLSEQRPQPMADDAQLGMLRREIVSLMESVAAGGLDPKLHAFLQEHLQAMMSAINLYPINGVAALRQAANALAGATYLMDEPTKKGWQQSSYWKRAARLFMEVCVVVGAFSALPSAGNQTIEFVENVSSLFGVDKADLCDDRQLGPTERQKAIEPSTGVGVDDDIQDGEVVEDDEPPHGVE